MSRVKFNVNTEYAYLQNFKILSSEYHLCPLPYQKPRADHVHPCKDAFTKHGIDRPVPVESLVKCKMQDNLEFLQWTKRYWDQYYPGGDYDAVARRKGAGAATAPPTAAPVSSRTSGGGGARRGTTPGTAAGGMRATGSRPAGAGGANSALVDENQQLKQTVEGLERERDFYFSKLRDIELLIQQAVEQDPELESDGGLIKSIQQILYSTEVSLTKFKENLSTILWDG